MERLHGNFLKFLLRNLFYGPELELQPNVTGEEFHWSTELNK